MSDYTTEGRYVPPATAPAPPAAISPDDQATRLRALMETMQRPPRPAQRPAQPPHPVRPPQRLDTESIPVRAPAHATPPTRHRTDMVERRARLVALASGKGGVGKTNISVNLAIALTAMGKQTTLLDADLGLANADVLCGLMPTRRLENVVGVSNSPRSSQSAPAALAMRDIAIAAPGGFRLIPGAAGIVRMAEMNQGERARLLHGIAELERDCDLVLVDTAAGLARDVITFMQVADLGLIIATPEPTAITDAYALIKCVLNERPLAQRAHHLRPDSPGGNGTPPRARLALVINQASDEKEALAVHARIAGACSKFLAYQLPLLGYVTQDARITTAVRKRKPLLLDAPRARASDDIRRLAASVAATVQPTRDTSRPRRRGLSRILARLVLRDK